MITKISILVTAVLFMGVAPCHAQQGQSRLRHWEIASADPDRIFLTFYGDAASGRGVTWRTAANKSPAYAEIAKATGDASFALEATRVEATTETIELNISRRNIQGAVKYHSAIFKDLQPDTLYAYRVGDGGKRWSEWIQFRTASLEAKPFKFVFFGDAQNGLLPHWSRTIRMAYQTAPDASFALHAGDLVNKSHDDNEWAQWFKAGSFIHSQWTGVPVTGNHEYIGDTKAIKTDLSIQWAPQFTLPVVEELPEELHETVYTVEYQGMQIIVLNSNRMLAEQKPYLESQLKKPGFRWRVVTFHHSLFSPRRGISGKSEAMEKEWRPLFEKYNVDMVLQGHDHAYTRGQVPTRDNAGFMKDTFQAMYVTSVSGPKQYPLNAEHMKAFAPRGLKTIRNGESTQFFQVISADGDKLNYKAYATTGELYDEATITKDFETGKKTISQEIPDVKERVFPPKPKPKPNPKAKNGQKEESTEDAGKKTSGGRLKIYYIRHAQGGHNVKKAWQAKGVPESEWPAYVGNPDVFTPQGLKEVVSGTEKLQAYHFDFVASSPMWRARNTVLPYLKSKKQKAEVWPELKEAKGMLTILDDGLPEVKEEILNQGKAIVIPDDERDIFHVRPGGENDYKRVPKGSSEELSVAYTKHVSLEIIKTIENRFGGSDKSILLAGTIAPGCRC